METINYHHPKKKFGQHFLKEHTVIETIVNSARINSTQEIIEIGPGLGILTDALYKTAKHVTAIEIDAELSKKLRNRYNSISNVSIICSDILAFELDAFTKEIGEYIVVANLPYYIGTTIIQKFLELTHKPKRLIIMLQKEVAESITTSKKNKNNTFLSNYVQYFGNAQIIAIIPPESFQPVPKVDSAIVKIDISQDRNVQILEDSENNFFSFIRMGFSAPRKQLRNVFSKATNIPAFEIETLLNNGGFNSKNRAGNLSLKEWAELYEFAKVHKWTL